MTEYSACFLLLFNDILASCSRGHGGENGVTIRGLILFEWIPFTHITRGQHKEATSPSVLLTIEVRNSSMLLDYNVES